MSKSSPETKGYTDVAGRANKKSEKHVFVRRKENASAARLAPYAMIDAVGLRPDVIPGRDGNQIPIRIYTPIGTGPFPVVTYYHGGGFVLVTINTYDEGPRALSTYAGAIVVYVEYRKARESPSPAAYNDAVDAYKWVLSNIGTYNGISSKVALAGESAGGNLATEVAIAARDQ